MSLWLRRTLLMLADAAILTGAGLRPLGALPYAAPAPGETALLLLAGAAWFIAVFACFGLYRRLWQYAGIRDMVALALACAVAGCGLALVWALPLPTRLIYWLLATAGVTAWRAGIRAWREMAGRRTQMPRRRLLIAGAGDAGAELVRELLRHPELGYEPAAFVDDAPAKWRQQAYGLQVAGACLPLEPMLRRHRIDELVIAMPSAPGAAIRAIWAEAVRLGLPVRILPPLADRHRAQGLVSLLRSVQIEDLLRRPEIQIDLAAVAGYLAGRVVMVTGAGGSIGSELCRQVARAGPAALILLGHGENSLFHIHAELSRQFPHLALHPVVADLQDQQRIGTVMAAWRPAVVFHAAAHKHVHLMELNPAEAVKNNILGTYHLGLAALQAGVERFVLISTDKAVAASSIMGASKRAAEAIVRTLAASGGTAFVTVRFGNVLGSRGSVTEIFRRQIEQGGPVTVTDPRATRFFMTIPEACRLVVQAAAMGGSGDLFILDMGEPVRILDLATDMIRLAGRDPAELPVTVVGLRPGEKLHETLVTADETVAATHHERILRVSRTAGPTLDVEQVINGFRTLAASQSVSVGAILALISDVPQGGTGHSDRVS